jgi:hypothetical protein
MISAVISFCCGRSYQQRSSRSNPQQLSPHGGLTEAKLEKKLRTVGGGNLRILAYLGEPLSSRDFPPDAPNPGPSEQTVRQFFDARRASRPADQNWPIRHTCLLLFDSAPLAPSCFPFRRPPTPVNVNSDMGRADEGGGAKAWLNWARSAAMPH